ncbi:peritrophic matrix protein 5-A precursor [Tribolium castaneum]|uniref:Peritrophic matrix protein 5-A n=1 Tax=Tribolium castaneum TaxID=7070 RepID=D1MAJ5_TRICA|nr:peritrophic matrix protein 5-A precursor [Tribolium castaneum]ACY95486.1 peritrophic matrix protein 5-A [Tribolium castaneum]EFA00422.1 hypothetical protein TcasGA2_TC003273 [Tribolium castaneum]|eukprot:NP_001280544.1 peritrophic matrix protein 5-A precursor [Tribolium castaneum]
MNAFTLLVLFAVSAFAEKLESDPLCAGVPPGSTYLFPYPGDCTKFYVCENGTKRVEDCPSGLWFNEALQACDHPDNSGCHPIVCPPSIVDFYPYPEDCTKYIECYHGNPETHTCPDNLWFNSVEKRCTDPSSSGCGEHSSSVEPTWSTPNPICWGVLPGQTVLRPYPGDCNKFYECYGSRQTEMNCPPHLYFNEARQMCDWPDVSGCDDTTETPNPNPTSTITPPTTPSGNDDPRCANGNNDYWPDPDCTKFVECYHGHGYIMDCPSGLYFDSVDKKCEDPSEADCGRTTPTPDPWTTTKSSDWTNDPDCPFPSADRYLFPYPGDCTKFLECWNGEKVAQECPAGLWFNPNLLVCDYPYHSGCKYGEEEQEV